jgi:hypothetical protein
MAVSDLSPQGASVSSWPTTNYFNHEGGTLMCSISKTFNEATKCFRDGDPEKMAQLGGTVYDARQKQISLSYLNHLIKISFPEGEIVPEQAGFSLTIEEKALILLYLGQASGGPLSAKWISMSELPGGMMHYNHFKAVSLKPIADRFSQQPEKLLQIAQSWGGSEIGIGDLGVAIPVFPRIIVGVFLWVGDEEVATNANMVFDAVAPKYLTTAELFTVATVISNRIMAGATL